MVMYAFRTPGTRADGISRMSKVVRIGMSRVRVGARWQRLTLWPRLAIAVTLGFGALFALVSLLALRAVDASTDRILRERLVVAQSAAAGALRVRREGAARVHLATRIRCSR